MAEELSFAGVSVSPRVFDTVVRRAAEQVEGVACVGAPYEAVNARLASFLPGTAPARPVLPAVGVRPEGSGVDVAVHVSVFFGYPFRTLAAEVRSAVAAAVAGLVGVEAASVDVFIDAVVFAKE